MNSLRLVKAGMEVRWAIGDVLLSLDAVKGVTHYSH